MEVEGLADGRPARLIGIVVGAGRRGRRIRANNSTRESDVHRHERTTAEDLRRAMREHPTGVVALTTIHQGSPVGATLGSFFSVSLQPPLVGFSIAQTSATWRSVASSGRFAIDILAAGQETIGRLLATSAVSKFENIRWSRSASGLPIIDGVIAHLECRVRNTHEAADHCVVIAHVDEARRLGSHPPLVHLDGTFHAFATAVTPGPPAGDRLTLSSSAIAAASGE